jgi:hypothetical protein
MSVDAFSILSRLRFPQPAKKKIHRTTIHLEGSMFILNWNRAPLVSLVSIAVSLGVPLAANSTRPPLALSYKSATTVVTGPADAEDKCPAEFVPIDTTGNGLDSFGPYTLSEDVCVDPANAVFKGKCKILHDDGNAFSGVFNGQFIPSGQISGGARHLESDQWKWPVLGRNRCRRRPWRRQCG